jgi:alkanesulfonate monooxygenase SsuD/methylene tetrahydromethanopterin reductase-like flavin-dependent oxidoreductase (luciferase family)
MPKLSVCLPTYSGASAFTNKIEYQELEAFVHAAEELGYTSALAPDHFMSGGEGRQLEAWMLLSALAQSTDRIRIGALVLEVAHRNPAFVAKMAGTLDYLSGGRLDLGIGNGRFRTEEEAYGFGWLDSAKERSERLTEAILVMKTLFTNQKSFFDGKYYQLNDATCEPSPLQRPWPRLWIDGDGSDDSFQIVAEHADTWNISAEGSEDYSRNLSKLKDQCASIGRDFGTIEKAIEVKTIILNDDAESEKLIDWTRNRYHQSSNLPRGRPRGRTEADHLISTKFITGSADECFQRVNEYVEAGAEHLAVNFLDYPRTDTLESFAQEYL